MKFCLTGFSFPSVPPSFNFASANLSNNQQTPQWGQVSQSSGLIKLCLLNLTSLLFVLIANQHSTAYQLRCNSQYEFWYWQCYIQVGDLEVALQDVSYHPYFVINNNLNVFLML